MINPILYDGVLGTVARSIHNTTVRKVRTVRTEVVQLETFNAQVIANPEVDVKDSDVL